MEHLYWDAVQGISDVHRQAVFLLYPLIRLLLGGKDSLAAVITTVIVEELKK